MTQTKTLSSRPSAGSPQGSRRAQEKQQLALQLDVLKAAASADPMVLAKVLATLQTLARFKLTASQHEDIRFLREWVTAQIDAHNAAMRGAP